MKCRKDILPDSHGRNTGKGIQTGKCEVKLFGELNEAREYEIYHGIKDQQDLEIHILGSLKSCRQYGSGDSEGIRDTSVAKYRI